MPQPSTINDCMRRNPLTIHVDANLVQAIDIIVENRLTGLTVTDDAGQPVGILSELDCLKAVLTAIYNDGDPEHTPNPIRKATTQKEVFSQHLVIDFQIMINVQRGTEQQQRRSLEIRIHKNP